MPRRKRGQEPRRAARRAATAAREAGARAARDDLADLAEPDRVWAEHQAWERARRVPPLVTPAPPPARPRRDVRAEVRAAIAAVEADFARWRRGDFS